MNKKIIIGIVGVVVIVGGAFYGGMVYGKSSATVRGQAGSGQFTRNTNGTSGTGTRGGMNSGIIFGEVISKDTGSITVKTQDGSTKIVLVASSTQVVKSSTGSLNDLTTGTNITVTGATNSDGSVTASNVQIRPVGSVPFGSIRQNQ